MNLDELIEGWVIRVSAGFADEVWVVRGYRHPTGSVSRWQTVADDGGRKLTAEDSDGRQPVVYAVTGH